jgi:hypothetical protein
MDSVLWRPWSCPLKSYLPRRVMKGIRGQPIGFHPIWRVDGVTQHCTLNQITYEVLHFIFLWPYSPIWALAYLHETLCFTSVF